MPTKTKTAKESIPAKVRAAIPSDDFAGPHDSFPIRNQADVDNAARLIGHADDPEAVKAAIIRIAKKKGLSLPDAWNSDKKESVTEAATPFTPKARVATFRTKFLNDGAQSRNKRTYPQEAVDRLVRSGQLALETPGSDPLTCYISHGEADQDNSLKLAGKITKVWKSGQDAWANIEMPDTTTGREAATLAKHGFLKTSLRATGAELRMSNSGGMPEVSGESLRLLGIDFTTTPGIETVTVEDVTLESANNHEAQDINEIFELPVESLLLEEVSEEEINQRFTSSVLENVEASSNAHDLMIASKSDMQAIHDHIATAQGRPCAPAGGMATEAGRKFAAATQAQLDAAHDKAAEVLGIECDDSDNMQDGDDDDGSNDPQSQENSSNQDVPESDNQSLEVSQEETMTPEEMIQALKEAGFTVAPPKTAEEKLQEALDAKLAAMQEAFDAKLAEAAKQMVAAAPKPQRQSLVEGANVNTDVPAASNPKIYRKGSYISERLKDMDWAELADRERPLPEGIDPTRLLQEMGHLYLLRTGYYNEA